MLTLKKRQSQSGKLSAALDVGGVDAWFSGGGIPQSFQFHISLGETRQTEQLSGWVKFYLVLYSDAKINVKENDKVYFLMLPNINFQRVFRQLVYGKSYISQQRQTEPNMKNKWIIMKLHFYFFMRRAREFYGMDFLWNIFEIDVRNKVNIHP